MGSYGKSNCGIKQSFYLKNFVRKDILPIKTTENNIKQREHRRYKTIANCLLLCILILKSISNGFILVLFPDY